MSFSITDVSSSNKVFICHFVFQKKKKRRNLDWILPAKSKKLSDRHEKHLWGVLRTGVVYFTEAIFPRWDSACSSPPRQYSGGEVGVCQSPRWYTEMESDSCQGGSGLPCPLATQEIKAGRRVHDDRLPLFTASWPYPYIEQRLTGPANHRKHITEQSWYIISMRSEWERKWRDFFWLCWGHIKTVCIYACVCVSLLSLCRSVAHFLHYISFALKASCLKSLLSWL